METKDLYKVLGESKKASQEEIRRTYRKLARTYHPDANRDDPKAEERFKEIQHAYEILSNPEKRREYDEGPRTLFGTGSPRAATQVVALAPTSQICRTCLVTSAMSSAV